jgi:hypothetical protein
MYSAVHSARCSVFTCAAINAEQTPQALCHVTRLVGIRLDACRSLKGVGGAHASYGPPKILERETPLTHQTRRALSSGKVLCRVATSLPS